MLTDEEIRELATTLILDHARDVEWSAIGERLPDDVPADHRVEVKRKIDDLIIKATITVKLPGGEGRMPTPDQLAEIQDRWIVSDKWRRLCGESRLFGPDEHHALEGVRHARQDVRALLAEVTRQRERAENAEAGLMKHAKQVDQVSASHEQMKTRLREAEANAKDLEDARTADGKRMVQADNKIRELEQQLAQVAKITDQIESAAASDSRNRDERIEDAIERDGVWSSSRDAGIARASMAADIQTGIAKRLRKALAGEGRC